MTRKEAFAEAITNNVYDLVSYTYRVSKQYVDDDPDLALSYDPRRHRFNVTVHDHAVDIPLKYNRLNDHVTTELFDEAKQFARDAYPSKGVLSVYDNAIINDTHALCIKHMDLSRESRKDMAFFTFNAGDGELDSVIQTQDKPFWRGIMQQDAKDGDEITLVDKQRVRYDELNDTAQISAVRDEIKEHVRQRNSVFDRHLDITQALRPNKAVSLRHYLPPSADDTPVVLSFEGLDELDHLHEM